MNYPYTTEPDDNGTLLVIFPQFPGATDALNEEHAKQRAQDMLDEILCSMLKDGEPIPDPLPGEKTVTPSLEVLERLAETSSFTTSLNEERYDDFLDILAHKRLNDPDAEFTDLKEVAAELGIEVAE